LQLLNGRVAMIIPIFEMVKYRQIIALYAIMKFSKNILLVAGLIVAVVISCVALIPSQKVDFSADIKPIFNKKCISCHGGVKKKAGFSLLFRDEALANTESGKPAIIPGKPDESEMIRRLTIKDPEERMPYKHDPLSEDEIEKLRKWIKQGAQWGEHWAYVSVKPVEIPDINNEWIRNDIDRFIYDDLKKEKISPSPEAEKEILLRRVSLDLTGLPPSKSLAERFLNDKTDKAYETLVDSLLASPQYGERWTATWLDLARYADTKGYERDPGRNIWRYRDWLIHAFNDDKPYDQFLTEQIAGDLMPNATDKEYIATAFHRNTMTNDEAGTDNEEFRTAAVLDRVNTTWEVLMGTTFACTQCHSHPYDPFKNDEYYKFAAFFNNTRDEDTEADYPLLYDFPDSLQQQLSRLRDWLKQNTIPEKAASVVQFVKTRQPAYNGISCIPVINSELNETKWLAMRNRGIALLKNVNLNDKNVLIYKFISRPAGRGVWQIHLDSSKGPVVASVTFHSQKKQQVQFSIAETTLNAVKGVHDLYFTYNSDLKVSDYSELIFEWFYFTELFPGQGKAGYAKNKKVFRDFITMNLSGTPVMMENPTDMTRTMQVFERGNWLVKGDTVQPDVPHSLNPLPANAPKNRLGLAMWLTDKKNPLTSRTMVNRLWEQLFGQGLVETLEDMGTQGMAPTHKKLLDHMSFQFMNDQQWSIKKLLKTMVLSATYRQSSKLTEELLQKDPYNKLYARGARVRLSAEQVRDQGLAASGLLSRTMYGASVYPFQPGGIWQTPWNGEVWKKSEGEGQYRRALYTYWKRTAPYPSMMTFDGVSREICAPRRIRTNTPLQALVTLNDEAYWEMAKYFGIRMKKEGGNDIAAQISKGYKWILFKPIAPQSLAELQKLYKDAVVNFKKDKKKALELMGGDSENNKPETAALVVVANAMLNLDEVVTKN